MQQPTEMKRREFLRTTTGVAGLIGLAAAGNSSSSLAAPGAGSAEVEKLLAEMEAQGAKMLSVPRTDGQFLCLLVKASRARNVLEVGTSQGYSAIWMSRALEETGGKMTTIDIAPEKVQLAKTNVGKAGLSHRVTFLEGDAHKIVTTLEGSFDFVFLDADKEGQMDYFNKLHPKKVVPGGIIAVHNAIRAANSMKDYLEMVRKHPDFDSVTLSTTLQDGFMISYRHRAQT